MTFADAYAGLYDRFYADKDYAGECALVLRLCAEHASGSVHRVLDLGCGTGGHAQCLVARGLEVVGVDRSEAMLRSARTKVAGARFVAGDLRTLALGERFDAVLMMFAVLGYQLEDADVDAALATARRHLRPGGALVFDVWHAPAVLRERPERRTRTYDTPGGPVTRVAEGVLAPDRPVCTVTYRLEGAHGASEERHQVRFFHQAELEQRLASAGLVLASAHAFPDTGAPLDDRTWNALYVATR